VWCWSSCSKCTLARRHMGLGCSCQTARRWKATRFGRVSGRVFLGASNERFKQIAMNGRWGESGKGEEEGAAGAAPDQRPIDWNSYREFSKIKYFQFPVRAGSKAMPKPNSLWSGKEGKVLNLTNVRMRFSRHLLIKFWCRKGYV